jgi:hypothetical protein
MSNAEPGDKKGKIDSTDEGDGEARELQFIGGEDFDTDFYEERIAKREAKIEEEGEKNQQWRSLYLHSNDKSSLEEIAESLEEPFNPSALILYHLTNSLLERIEAGKYDPYKVITRVGAQRQRSVRENIDIRPRGDLGWERIENVADLVNRDMELLFLNAYRKGTLLTIPVRVVSTATIIRAGAREVAKGEAVFSKKEGYWAEDLREEEEGGTVREIEREV